MTTYSEPTQAQLRAARAAVFLAETRRALRGQQLGDTVLTLEEANTPHNQTSYRLHATVDGLPVTPAEGHYVHPISGTPATTARMLVIYANNAARRQSMLATPPAGSR